MAKLTQEQVEDILRVYKLHESTCTIWGFLDKVKGKSHKHKKDDPPEPEFVLLENTPPPVCNCWLSVIE